MNKEKAVIHIYNRDDILSQHQWVHFIDAVNQELEAHTPALLFGGHSYPGCFQQHYCWIIEFPYDIDNFRQALREVEGKFGRDLVTLIIGEISSA